MKKRTLIAVAAALLLSGGVFMKVNQVYNIRIDALIETVTAGADPTGGPDGHYGAFAPMSGKQQKESCSLYVIKNGDRTYCSNRQDTPGDSRCCGVVSGERWWCMAGKESCVVWVCHQN